MSGPLATDGPSLAARLAERERVLTAFLEGEQDRLARAAHDLARTLARGGTLLATGTGSAATDAAHVAVEFMHPVIVGKRALPALALSNDPTGFTSVGALARGDDAVLALSHGPDEPALTALLSGASARGLLTIAMGAGASPRMPADHAFAVPSDDPAIVQEVQETAYHVLWELVHVFFEHPGLLEDVCITCGDVAVEAEVVAAGDGSAVVERDGLREEVAVELVGEVRPGERLLCHAGVALERLSGPGGAVAATPRSPSVESPPAATPGSSPAGSPPAATEDPTGFLYPFLQSGETDLQAVLADARASSLQKGADATRLRREIDVGAIEACARDIRERLRRGGRLIAFGNGGSATDAQDAASDCLAAGWAAIALPNDSATVTAVGNDVGYDNVFSRQLIALARPDDVALAISTSGSSPNVVAGLEEAQRRGMLTCAITGYDGGRLATLPFLDHLIVVPGDYIPRVQEAHATVYHLLLQAVGARQ